MDYLKLSDNEKRQFLYENYVEKKMSWRDIAKLVGTYPNRIMRDANRLGIKSRSRAEAQKLALSESRIQHPTKGKRLPEHIKDKISISLSKLWNSMTDEERRKRADIAKELWDQKTEAEKQHFFYKGQLSLLESSKSGSTMEKAVYDFLTSRGYKVDIHKEHILKDDKLHIDLYIPEVRLAIEIDGPSHYSPIFGYEKLQKTQAADKKKNGLILGAGMALLRVQLKGNVSRKYVNEIGQKIVDIIEQLRISFPTETERYFVI